MKTSLKKLTWILSQSKLILPLLIVSILISSMLSLISVYNAVLSKSLIDSAISGELQQVIKWLSIIGIITLINIIMYPIDSFLYTYCSSKMKNALHTKFFKHIIHSEYLQLSKYHSVNILTRITNDISTINGFIMGTICKIITSLITLSTAFFTMIKLAPSLTLFSFALFPILLIINKYFGKKIKEFYIEIQELDAKYKSFIQESIQNIMIVKSFCKEKNVINKINSIQNEKLNLALKRTKLKSISNICFQLGSSGVYFLVYCWGAISIASGAITFGTLTALLQLFGKIESPLSTLIGSYSSIITTMTAAERLMELENISLEPESNVILENIKSPTIKFNKINFSYNNNQPVLKDISCNINPGEIVALVGPSGQGKTTIIKLLLSLIHADKGDILLCENNNIQNINKIHRNLISYVPQGNTLFSGTIKENITYGNEFASYDEILEAAKLSSSYNFIDKLDNKFDTILGEKGLGLSEGQSQRIAIARAFLRKKPILILDEATSSLDSNTELDILTSIKSLNHKPICIIITHRPCALTICDKVFELKDGYLNLRDNDSNLEIASDIT